MAVTIDGTTGYVLARCAVGIYAEPVTLTTVGKNVRRLRLAAGIKSQTELAKKMGVPQARASDLENDRYAVPETKTLMLAALAIGCAIDDLLENVDPDFDVRKLTKQRGARPAPTLIREGRKAIELIEGLDDDGQKIALKAISAFASGHQREPPRK